MEKNVCIVATYCIMHTLFFGFFLPSASALFCMVTHCLEYDASARKVQKLAILSCPLSKELKDG